METLYVKDCLGKKNIEIIIVVAINTNINLKFDKLLNH